MVTTTLALVALTGALSASPSPNWQSDYGRALTLASSEKKPIAVFIGHGSGATTRMVQDGTIQADAAKVLHDTYVCVFVDTDTAAGKTLAGQFSLTEGLVISSPGGDVQALRHTGQLSGTELTQKLNQFASAGTPATTVNSGVGAAVGGCVNGSCRLGTSAGYAAPAYAPYTYGSSCPNGRCPLQR